MKKIIVICLLSVFVVLPVFSQVSWNVKSGVNLSKEINSVTSVKPGFQVGVGMDYFFTEQWGIQTSMMFITKGYKIGEIYYPLGGSASVTKNNMYLQIPLLLAYRINLNKNFRIVFSGGGYGSYGVGGKYKIDRQFENGPKTTERIDIYPNDYNRWDAGLTAGVALEVYNKYTVGFMGEWGLVKIDKHTRNHTYAINLGYKF